MRQTADFKNVCLSRENAFLRLKDGNFWTKADGCAGDEKLDLLYDGQGAYCIKSLKHNKFVSASSVWQ